MAGYNLGQEGHIVNVLPPTTGIAGSPYGDWFHMKEASHCTLIIQTGTVTSSSTFIVYESTTSGGTVKSILGGATTGINYKAVATAASDTFSAPASFTSSGLTTGVTNNLCWAIEVDSSDLSDGYPYLNVNFSSTAAIQVSCVAVLTGLRYAADRNLSAID